MIKLEPNTTLVMLSGGIDSTAVLYRALVAGDRVHVHHVHMVNQENRHIAEAAAVTAIVAELRAMGFTFDYSESTIELPSVDGRFTFDAELVGFVSGYITHRSRGKVARRQIGVTKTDSEIGVGQRRGVENIYRAFGDNQTVREFPLSNLTKQQIWDSLPDSLRRLTWSCRTPLYVDNKPQECGRCKTCRLELNNLQR